MIAKNKKSEYIYGSHHSNFLTFIYSFPFPSLSLLYSPSLISKCHIYFTISIYFLKIFFLLENLKKTKHDGHI